MRTFKTVYHVAASPAEEALMTAHQGGRFPDDDYDGFVIEYDDDLTPLRIVGTDGGEPEDQTLGRDWSWVTPALNAAYEAGRTGK